MRLRRRTYLAEATYERDKRIRDVAEKFYRQLLSYLKKYPDELVPRRDGGFSVHAAEFWDHPLRKHFGVVFMPKRGSVQGGMGRAGNTDVLVLYNLIAPGNRKHLYTRTTSLHDVVIHEMVHFLDPGSKYKEGTAKKYDAGQLDAKAYFNDAGEWNAFWQEGAAKLERLIKTDLVKNPKAVTHFFGDGSLRALQDRVNRFWDVMFLQSMNKKTRRKFDKRLAQLWLNLKKKGLL